MRTFLIICLCVLASGATRIGEGSETSGDNGGVTMSNEAAKEKERRVPLDDTALAKVAADGIDVDWEDLKGLATLLAPRVPVQVCHHPH